jgi:transcriptional regulator with XRE-family HTH domain
MTVQQLKAIRQRLGLTQGAFAQALSYARTKKKRVLIGETREQEAARLAKEIATHPVMKCEPGAYTPSSSRPSWSSKPLIPLAELTVAEGIAKKIMRKP